MAAGLSFLALGAVFVIPFTSASVDGGRRLIAAAFLDGLRYGELPLLGRWERPEGVRGLVAMTEVIFCKMQNYAVLG